MKLKGKRQPRDQYAVELQIFVKGKDKDPRKRAPIYYWINHADSSGRPEDLESINIVDISKK